MSADAIAPDTFSPEDLDQRFGEDAALALLQQVGQAAPADLTVRSLLVQLLLATPSHTVRNAAALTMVDLDAREDVDALLVAMRRPDLRQHNGTLVYAFNELGGQLPLDVLVQLIEQGAYEASAEALLLAGEGRVRVPAGRLAALRSRLSALAEAADPAMAEAARSALDMVPDPRGIATP